MVIPSLLAHAVNGLWCVTVEELQRLQGERGAWSVGSVGSVERGALEADPVLAGLFYRAGRVAVVEINGTLGKNLSPIETRYLGGVDYDQICLKCDAAEADPHTDTIVFLIRSPGGMALGCAECGDRIAEISKPTIAYSDFCMCSGAYWLGAQCDAVYSSGSAFLGSIGVLATYLDTSKALEELGIKVNGFSAGKWKLAGAPWKAMSEEERGMFQARVERYYGQFTAAVTRNRTIAQEFMEGQSMDGMQAVEAGLCDGVFACLDDLLVYLNSDGEAPSVTGGAPVLPKQQRS